MSTISLPVRNKALVYIRRSVMKKDAPSTSPEKQRDACVAEAERRGWQVQLFEDVGGHRSGRSETKRPEWLRLKNVLMSDSTVCAVVVHALDRSSRSPRDFFQFMELLEKRRVEFVSVTQPQLDTTTAMGRMLIGMLSIWAGFEADIDSQRTRETIVWKQSSGIHVGDIPLGYDRRRMTIVDDGDRYTAAILVPNKEETKLIRLMFRLYGTGQYTYRSLANHLNTLGYRTKNKLGEHNLFTFKNVQLIIGNHWLYRGWVVRNEGKPDEERIRGKHQPIISDELAEKALLVAKSRLGILPKHINRPNYFALTNLYCAACGKRMGGRKEHGVRLYRHWVAKGDCTVRQCRADDLERSLVVLFGELDLTGYSMNEVMRMWLPPPAFSLPAEDAEECLRRLDHQLLRAKRLYIAGDITEEEYEKEKSTIAATRAPIVVEREQQESDTVTRHLADAVKDLGEAVRTADLESLRTLVNLMFERIETDGKTIASFTLRRWFAGSSEVSA